MGNEDVEPKQNLSRRGILGAMLAGLMMGVNTIACKIGAAGQYPPGARLVDAKKVTATPEPKTEREVDLGTYVIIEGDNLTRIADKYAGLAIAAGCSNFSYHHIVRANQDNSVGPKGASEEGVVQSTNDLMIKTGNTLKIKCYISN
ncbi:MAG: hypothetical protein COU66_03805 [Candidatus Pacebacteria bacterium CG10_big_fil_rev_8_21_14_0_10_44_11]|nr:MAG: hypothetical protein COU66_03805 [Candidatus Pacebacteria bacterium CG10_big_fil_rev_8_21_14_0_10_44_11]